MRAFEKGAREVMSQLAFWVILAYFVLACVTAGLFSLYRNQAHEAAIREASTRAAASTQVGQCFTSVKTAPVLDGFIDAHEAIIENGLIANRASLNLTAKNDPLRPVREKSIARLEKAERNVKQLRSLINGSTPTETKCVRLATSLHVDPSRYIQRRSP